MNIVERFANYIVGSKPKTLNTVTMSSMVTYLLHKMFMHPDEPMCFTVHEAAFILIMLYLVMQMNLNQKQPEK